MKRKFYLPVGVFAGILLFLSSCRKNGPEFCRCSPDNLVINTSTFSTGFNNPRGLKFGPDGYLYVAEGGIGGKDSSVGLCMQVPGAGPYIGSITGSRISRVNH